MNWQLVAFFLFTGVILYSAYRVVVDENVTHAALYLVIAFVGVAGFYVLLGAEFLAAVQVLVYAGAVMTLMIFGIMLSEIREVRGQRVSLIGRLTSPRWGALPLVISATLVVLLVTAFWNSTLPGVGTGKAATLSQLGTALLSTYMVPFEVASILLLAAMIGAIVLSRREGEG